ncbi:transposase [Teredinibacter turnerae]|uniref:transposase n=1 Tax=Teredinibacter turnerae TaxID=2426 RepID=UPI00039DCBE5|nr:transposase [Teredinibacter turnerae]
MTRPRKEQVSISDTSYYHIVSRCVRRSYLCGFDKTSGKSYEHRRQWIEDRIRLLSSIFAIDICAYAVMSNHIHIVVKLHPESIKDLPTDNILKRWCCLFKGPTLVQNWRQGKELDSAKQQTVSDIAEQYRNRLMDIGWFMKCLVEPVARMANKEDQCTGHFWESRYKSQALLTEEALLSAMAYVDLNPIRASMADSPEKSDHTSIKERIKPCFDLVKAIGSQQDTECLQGFDLPVKPLLHFEASVKNDVQDGILFGYTDYLKLIDATGRCIRKGKRGYMPAHLKPILERLHIDEQTWLINTTQFELIYQKRFRRRPILQRNSA